MPAGGIIEECGKRKLKETVYMVHWRWLLERKGGTVAGVLLQSWEGD